jgi:hypothetical protein
MKHLRQFCASAVLTLALSLSAFAGTIDCGSVPPPPPQETTLAGDIECGFMTTNETSSTETTFVDPMTELTLNILQSVMVLF